MRRLAWLLVLVPGLAAADIRLDLEPIPDLATLEPVHPLDRTSRGRRAGGGILGYLGIGYGRHAGADGMAGEGAVQVGLRRPRFVVAAASELVAGGDELVRGRHTGFLELRTDDRGSEDDISIVAAVGANVEHGEARALAPVHLGPGRRDHAAAHADVLIGLEPDKDDVIWAALAQADGSVTRWHASPALDRAQRGGFGLGVSLAPNDGELPRGRIDLVRARVEHANIRHDSAARRAVGVAPHDAQVRTIDVTSGFHEFAGWIDHEVLFAVTAELGARWIESDATAGRIADTFFTMELGGHLKWRRRTTGRREFGFALARAPGPTPDGQHHASDWRLQMLAGAEDDRFVLSARGGISWLTHISGGATNPDTTKRYGSHLEGFAKIGLGIELGGYHAMSYEPRVAGDPWSTPRAFATEVGVLARWRPAAP